MKVVAAPMRTTVTEDAGAVELRIPSRRNVLTLIFVLAWLGGWAIGEVSVLGILTGALPSRRGRGPDAFAKAFLLFWVICWTVGGAVAAYSWIWMAFGREIVRLDGLMLSIARVPIPFPRRRDFDWQQVRNLRVEPRRSRTSRKTLIPSDGTIAFDYGARTYRFGDVDEAEAALLIKELEGRFGVRSAS